MNNKITLSSCAPGGERLAAVRPQAEKMSGTHCVLWSKYVITRSPSSSKRLLTWLRYSGTFQTQHLSVSVTKTLFSFFLK